MLIMVSILYFIVLRHRLLFEEQLLIKEFGEAGLISTEESVVGSVADSILGLLEKPESKEMK